MKLICLVLGLILFSNYSIASDFVYRVDSRGPDEIFENGFSARGDNRNLREHVTGSSCREDGNTRYIATTNSIESADSIARSYFTRGSGISAGTLYIYTIRADNNFYSVRNTAEQLLRNDPEYFNPQERAMIRIQNEYVALDVIDSTNIREAIPITFNRDTYQVIRQTSESQSNRNYQSIHTEINSNLIPNITNSTSNNSHRLNAFGNLFSSCFSLKGVDRHDMRKNNNARSFYIDFYDARQVLLKLTTNQ
ncbi:TPA: pertussis toxin-like subunit ArtA [Proteus mirabilis]|nr:pertussis toxin-like subunit ArtA [Proteus mirabilis]HAU5535642.1 pertussis toxin-like subunit ArtA [Proteus mirabilis]HAU5539280.1 pertussis toxin-like subunit ArtA [Proteus mirabilis]HAU5542716.1 pertussis toxin-like subunit ArtA [Proteus mirabilis]HAU5573653.1 pertussis toxin-like subunit ArtA [Proteus mirabilis]